MLELQRVVSGWFLRFAQGRLRTQHAVIGQTEEIF